MKFEEIENQMLSEGYEPGGYNQIDIDVCHASTCEECGRKGLKYAGFKKDGSYRAFAICPQCDEAFEF